MRDFIEGPTPAEAVALCRLAEQGCSIPPNLTMSLVSKGWIMITNEGVPLITLAGRVVIERAQSVDLEVLASAAPPPIPVQAAV